MPNRIVIRNGILISMVLGDEPRLADLYIQDDQIAAILPETETAPFPAETADTQIDARGCVVMPGLINAHTHTPMTLMRSTSDDVGYPSADRPVTLPPDQDWRKSLTADDHYWSSRLAIAEMIRTGTTTFVDMYHDMDRVAQAVIDSGVRGALGWEILTFRNDPNEWLPYDEPTAQRTFEECARFAADWHGKGDGRVMTLIAPHETATCHEPWLSRSAQLAEELGRDITIHVAESQWEVDVCRQKYDCTPVEALERSGLLAHRVIGAHSVLLTDRDIEILCRYRYTAAACLGAYLKLAVDPTPVARLLNAGINVALGTDSAGTNNNLNLWDEVHLAATLPAFLARDASLVPGDSALRMATIGGARALGLERDLGTLEPGKKADVLVVDVQRPHLYPQEGVLMGNLTYCASGHEVRDVLVDGRVLLRDFRIVAFDEGEVLRQAEAIIRQRRLAVGLPQRYGRP
jgi:5-methylthioadenosine/S-adenosylhomocysteine deaminase